ncbi:unnamed protein product, partial [Sphagnum compactum]
TCIEYLRILTEPYREYLFILLSKQFNHSFYHIFDSINEFLVVGYETYSTLSRCSLISLLKILTLLSGKLYWSCVATYEPLPHRTFLIRDINISSRDAQSNYVFLLPQCLLFPSFSFPFKDKS